MAKVLSLALLGAAALAAPPLQSYNIDTSDISVSGISAGGYMTVQAHIAMSDTFKAAAVVAGGPYYCAHGSEEKALSDCMTTPELINVKELETYTQDQSKSGAIDAVSNLASSKVILWSGLIDTTVHQGVMVALDTYYRDLGVTAITKYFNFSAQHGWVTDFYGNSCYQMGSPYILNCHFDLAGEIVKQFYPANYKPPRGAFNASNLIQFDQAALGGTGAGLLADGYLYVPAQCQSKATACKLHVNFHGCEQSSQFLQDRYVAHTGLNMWAETANMIVVYPQCGKDLINNPNGCFDWWGYSGANYASKSGKQLTFVQNLVKKITGK